MTKTTTIKKPAATEETVKVQLWVEVRLLSYIDLEIPVSVAHDDVAKRVWLESQNFFSQVVDDRDLNTLDVDLIMGGSREVDEDWGPDFQVSYAFGKDNPAADVDSASILL